MDDFIFNIKLIVQQCHKCSIVFAIPGGYEANRRDDGQMFYCPNGHKLEWPGIAPRSKLKKQLDAANAEKTALKNCNVGLRSKLDQAEAMLAEHGLTKTEKAEGGTVDPPPSPPLAPRESEVVDPPQGEEA